MEEITNSNNQPINPRRRKRSKWEIFKEAYLPMIIVAVAAILIIVFIRTVFAWLPEKSM